MLLPAPISGRFQHHCIGYNADFGVLNPKDIEGKQVGNIVNDPNALKPHPQSAASPGHKRSHTHHDLTVTSGDPLLGLTDESRLGQDGTALEISPMRGVCATAVRHER